MPGDCSVCDKKDVRLLRCARCFNRAYCGPECQTADWPTHKTNCIPRNFILKVDLHPRHITNPRITRTLSCPAKASFADLSRALIVAFGWASTHIYEFEVFNHSNFQGREDRLVAEPPLFKIADFNTFDPGEVSETTRDSSKITLFKVLDDPQTRGKAIHYMYDFGDNWEHVISCTGRADPTSYFNVLEGEGHCCAEDVGGWTGWLDLLQAYDAPNPDQAQKDKIEWFETSASNQDPAGLRGENRLRWDQERINEILGEFTIQAATPGSIQKSVLLISFEKQSYFDETYSAELAELRSRATVTESTHIASAMQQLSLPKSQKPTAVIITDPGVLDKEWGAIHKALAKYARSGGTVIFGFHISSFGRPDDLNKFFRTALKLNWEIGAYTRNTLILNPAAETNLASPLLELPRGEHLLREFSMKGLYLKNTKPEEMIYVENVEATQSPAVFAAYGKGYIGWIGDVNTEDGTRLLLVAMCGI